MRSELKPVIAAVSLLVMLYGGHMAIAANSAPNLPSVWQTTGGGQGPQGSATKGGKSSPGQGQGGQHQGQGKGTGNGQYRGSGKGGGGK